MDFTDKTRKQYNAYATIFEGGESDGESQLTEDEYSGIWYLIVSAIINNSEEIPKDLLRDGSSIILSDWDVENIPIEQLERMLKKINFEK
tara:strand:- start:6 stop:275 length:270 start_codon:yes stop_codon:yes gene_type:complete